MVFISSVLYPVPASTKGKLMGEAKFKQFITIKWHPIEVTRTRRPPGLMEGRRWRREDRRREPGPGRLLRWTPTSATSGRGSLDLTQCELRTFYNIHREMWTGILGRLFTKSSPTSEEWRSLWTSTSAIIVTHLYTDFIQEMEGSLGQATNVKHQQLFVLAPNSKLMRWLPTIILIVALDLRCGRYPRYRTTLHTNEIWNEIFSSFKLFPNQFTTGPPNTPNLSCCQIYGI